MAWLRNGKPDQQHQPQHQPRPTPWPRPAPGPWLPSQHRLARGGDFIHAAGPGPVGRVLDQLRVGFDLFGDGDHGVDELVELQLALGLGGLDHERAVHDQREAHGVRMEAVIDEALGDVAGAHAEFGLAIVAEHHLVHVGRSVGQIEVRLELLADVDGVEHRVHGGVAQARAAVRQDVGQRAHQHAEVAVEGAHAADGVLAPVIEGPFLAGALEARHGQERLEGLLHGHRTGARTAAAVRRREGLVQVEVHHVHAEIAGPRDAHQRVHVGAVHVEHGALGVQNLGRLHDVLFEHAERVGVGHHERGHIVGRRAAPARRRPARRWRWSGCSRPRIRRWRPWPGWCRAPNRE